MTDERIHKRLAKKLVPDEPFRDFVMGEVVSNDGGGLLTVTLQGSTVEQSEVHYAAGTGWTPAASDIVWCLKKGQTIFVLAKQS